MKKNIKKFILPGMAGLMMSGSLFMAPDLAGEVRAEEEDVFQVLFPTDTDHVFDFIMDPQGLICMTDAAAYGDLTFEEGATLFFRRQDGRVEEDYSSSSDVLVITNMGTADVEIVLSASILSDSMEKITLTDDSTFTDDTEASLYLALTDGECTVPVTGETDTVIRATLPGSREAEGAHGEYRFWLVGAVNSGGDWSEVTDEAPKVTVTWSASAVSGGQDDTEQSEDGKDPDDLKILETIGNQGDSEITEIVENPDNSEISETVENPDEQEGSETEEPPSDSETSESRVNQEDSNISEGSADPGTPEVEQDFDEYGEPAESDDQGNTEPMEEEQVEKETSWGAV